MTRRPGPPTIAPRKLIRGLRTLAIVLVASATGGCLWLQGTAVETSSIPQQASGGAAKTGDPARPGTSPTDPQLTADDPSLPALSEARWRPIEPVIAVLPGGVRVGAGQFPDRPTAHVRLTLAHSRTSARQIGLARLVGELIVDTPVDQGAKPSLRRAVENSGGSLDVSSDANSTTIAFSVPSQEWRWLTLRLAESVASVPTSGARVEAWSTRLARDYGQRWSDEPLDAALRRVRAFELEGVPRWLETVEDADLRDVAAFYAQAYKPSRATMVLAVPDATPDAAIEHAARSLSGWIAQRGATGLPDPVDSSPPASGLFWGEIEGHARFSTAVDLPPVVADDAAARWVVAEVLAGSAVDGRIPAALAELATNVRIADADDGPSQFRSIIGDVAPDATTAVRRAVEEATRSLRSRPPSSEELRLAARRARLHLAIRLSQPATWSREVARGILSGARPSLVIAADGKRTRLPAKDLLTRIVARLDAPENLDVRGPLEAAANAGSIVVVLGSDLTDRPEHGEMPGSGISSARRDAVAADLEDQERAAREVLTLALRAVGGAPAVLGLGGYRAASATRSGHGPEVIDTTWFRLDGQFRRVRRVLASRIETVIGPDLAIETLVDQKHTLDEAERRALLDDATRNPLVLLAQWARGRTTYRQTSIRTVHDRPMAVLERTSGEPGSLRLLIDAESGLIRAVISSVDLGNGIVYRREEWRDYRAAGRGLRAPHHLTTWFDEGTRGLVTTFDRVDAEAPDAQELQPGGPTR